MTELKAIDKNLLKRLRKENPGVDINLKKINFIFLEIFPEVD